MLYTISVGVVGRRRWFVVDVMDVVGIEGVLETPPFCS